MSVSNKDFARAIKKLRISDNTVVVVKLDSEIGDPKTMEAFADALGRTKLKNVILVSVENIDNVFTLSETEMARYGWFRKETLTKLLNLNKRSKLYGEKEKESDVES